MENAKTALEVLSWGGGERAEKVALCICCKKFGNKRCPHLGNEPKGHCDAYLLDKRRPAVVEARVLKHLGKKG